MEEGPWAAFTSGQAISPVSLGKILKGYGIKSSQRRAAGKISRFYDKNDFQEAFDRYTPCSSGTSGTSLKMRDNSRSQSGTNETSVPDRNSQFPNESSPVPDVPDVQGGGGDIGGIWNESL